MAIPVTKLNGMVPELETVLKEKGITNSDQFLEAIRTPKQRKELAKTAGIEARAVLELGNRADLSRVKGIAGVYSDLMEATGVDTVKELAQRRADNLHAKILETNEQTGLSKQPPSAKHVEDWIAQAKGLDRMIEY